MDNNTQMLINPIPKEQAHEMYLQLTDIQAQLESDTGDTLSLLREKRRLRWNLGASGYDPDSEPEECWPENWISATDKPEIKWDTQCRGNHKADIHSILPLNNGIKVQIDHPQKDSISPARVCVLIDGALKFKHEFAATTHMEAQKQGLKIALHAFETAREKAQQNENTVRAAIQDLYPDA